MESTIKGLGFESKLPNGDYIVEHYRGDSG